MYIKVTVSFKTEFYDFVAVVRCQSELQALSERDLGVRGRILKLTRENCVMWLNLILQFTKGIDLPRDMRTQTNKQLLFSVVSLTFRTNLNRSVSISGIQINFQINFIKNILKLVISYKKTEKIAPSSMHILFQQRTLNISILRLFLSRIPSRKHCI